MDQQETQRILDFLGPDFPAVTAAIKAPGKRYEHDTIPLLGVYLTPADMTLELFDRFRETEWAIFYTINQHIEPPTDGTPFTVWEYATVGFVRTVPVTLPEICYHVTGIENEASIRTHGIQIGALRGKESRGKFADSRFYVNVAERPYVSLWTELLYDKQPALVFSVRTTGLKFIEDPHCALQGIGVNGYILVGTLIPADRIGEPKRVGPPAPCAQRIRDQRRRRRPLEYGQPGAVKSSSQ